MYKSVRLDSTDCISVLVGACPVAVFTQPDVSSSRSEYDAQFDVGTVMACVSVVLPLMRRIWSASYGLLKLACALKSKVKFPPYAADLSPRNFPGAI